MIGTEWSGFEGPADMHVSVDQESVGVGGSANWGTPALVRWRKGTGFGCVVHVFVSAAGVYVGARKSTAPCLCQSV